MSIKLSICMMVKNEEKNIDRCLKSLQPLRDAVSSELIIVDTGSTDNTVEIAEKYTDKLYFHPWNNNFSQMRNISISYAKGEWIFIIDGDEVLNTYNDIIKYIKSDIKRVIGAAAITVKNLSTNDENYNYAFLQSPRLFRNDGFFHYEGTVHNDPIFKGQCLALNDILVHYGYISTDKELMERKFNRTKELLEKEIQKNPDNIYYQYQLSVTYMMHKDYKKALNESIKSYNMFKNLKDTEKKLHSYVLPNYIKISLINELYYETERVSKEALKIQPDNLDIYFYLAEALNRLNKYDEAINAFRKYIELCENYENISIRFNPTVNISTLSSQNEARYNIAYALYKKEEIDGAIRYIKTIERDSEFFMLGYKLLVEICFKILDFTELIDYYKENIYDASLENKQIFFNTLEENKSKLSKEKKIELISYFSGTENSYFDLNKIRYSFYEGSSEIIYMIQNFIKKVDFNLLEKYYADVLYFCILNKISINEIIYNLTNESIQIFMDYLLENHSDFNEILRKYLIANEINYFMDLKSQIILERCYLIMDMDTKETETYLDIFKNYITNGIKYLNLVYNMEFVKNGNIDELKNEELKFFFYLDDINKCNTSNKIEALSNAIKVYPYMKRGIELLIKGIEEEFENNTINSEFESYKFQVKETIKSLIASGDLINAESLIKEYESIVSDDIEIVLFKSQIGVAKLKQGSSSEYKM